MQPTYAYELREQFVSQEQAWQTTSALRKRGDCLATVVVDATARAYLQCDDPAAIPPPGCRVVALHLDDVLDWLFAEPLDIPRIDIVARERASRKAEVAHV